MPILNSMKERTQLRLTKDWDLIVEFQNTSPLPAPCYHINRINEIKLK